MEDEGPSPTLEMHLLGSLIGFIETGEGLAETAALRELFLNVHPTDIASWIRHTAAAKVLGEEVTPPARLPIGGNRAEQLYARTALAWMAWAAGERSRAKKILDLPLEEKGGGEIHLMALGFWCRAVGDLLRDDHEEARRYFKRAMEVGSQFGTESSLAIQWAYVGTFFFHGVTSSERPSASLA